MSTQLQQALGLPGLSEFDQCALLLLAAAYVWGEKGCPNQAPHQAQIDSLGPHLRLVESQQASQCVAKIADPLSQWENGISTQSQNAMTPNHDRPLHGLPPFSHHGLARIREKTSRIIDIDSSGRANTIDMRISGLNVRDGIYMDLTIFARGGNVTSLTPSHEAASGAWGGLA